MEKPIRIMHIDPDYNVTYLIKCAGFYFQSLLSVEEAVDLLRTEKIDLIISEPHNRVILPPRGLRDSSQLKQDEKSNNIYRLDHGTRM
jgi:hypothetical protein